MPACTVLEPLKPDLLAPAVSTPVNRISSTGSCPTAHSVKDSLRKALGMVLLAASAAALGQTATTEQPVEINFAIETGLHQPGAIRSVSCGDHTFLSFGEDRVARRANTLSGRYESAFRLPVTRQEFVSVLATAPGCRWIALGIGSGLESVGELVMLETSTGQPIFRAKTAGRVRAIHVFDGGGALLYADGARTVKLVMLQPNGPRSRDFDVGQRVKSFVGVPGLSKGVLMVGEGKGPLSQWQLLADGQMQKLSETASPFAQEQGGAENGVVSYSPDGRLLAMGSDWGQLVLLRANTFQVTGKVINARRAIAASTALVASNQVEWAGADQVVWAGESSKVVGVYIDAEGRPTSRAVREYSTRGATSLVRAGGRVFFFENETAGAWAIGSNSELKQFPTLSGRGGGRESTAGMSVESLIVSYDGMVFTKAFSSISRMFDARKASFFDVKTLSSNTGYRDMGRTHTCERRAYISTKEDIFEAWPDVLDLDSSPGWRWDGSLFKRYKRFDRFPRGVEATSLCVSSPSAGVFIGTDGALFKYDLEGNQRWVINVDAPVRLIGTSGDGRLILTLSTDNVWRWYQNSDGKLQFSLIHRDHSLSGSAAVVYLPEGFYFTLDERWLAQVGWDMHFQNRREPIRVDARVLWDVFYRPDVVLARLAGQNTRPLIGGLTVDKALSSPPPLVRLGPLSGKVDEARVILPYMLTPQGGGVAEVRVFHNGKLIRSDGSYHDAVGKTYAPVAGSSEAAGRYAGAQAERNATAFAAAAMPGEIPTTLRDQLVVRSAPEKQCAPGQLVDPCTGEIEIDVIPSEENTITVVAFNRDNTIQSVPASVSFKSTLPPEEPRLWMVSVGIDLFKSISPLKNARKDAQDFACTYAGRESLARLGVPCGEEGRAHTLFKPDRIHLVDALLDQAATKTAILQALDKVSLQARPGDTFVWFVASHGLLDGNGLFGIVAHDTRCLNADCTAIEGHISSNEILEASKKIKAMKQLVVLDTCHAGGLDSKLSGLYDARVSLLAKNMGLHLYASAQATEQAQDGKPGTNGTFTAQLLAGIRGAAPKNAQGQISVMTLGQWARQKTIEATTASSQETSNRPAQTPVIQHFGQDAILSSPR